MCGTSRRRVDCEQVRRIPITGDPGDLVAIVAQADLAVDHGGFDREREIDVEEAVERIGEPAPAPAGAAQDGAGETI